MGTFSLSQHVAFESTGDSGRDTGSAVKVSGFKSSFVQSWPKLYVTLVKSLNLSSFLISSSVK